MRAATIAFCLLLACVLVPLAGADIVVPRKGKAIRGDVRRAGVEVVVNPYYATTPEMTWGVVRLPADAVKEIREEKARALPSGPSEPWDDRPDLRRALGAILMRDSAMARRDGAASLRAEHGVSFAVEVVEPLARAWRAPRGTRHEVALSASRSDPVAGGATYSVLVPESYHPLEPAPLVVALHGGLHRRKEDGRFVFLGTARDVFALLEAEARRRRWILVCPNAVEAPWRPRTTEALVERVLAEVESRYAVDRSRRYLVGFGAGADAAMELAASQPALFAAAGAASAAEPGLARAVSGRRVPIWLYHGEANEHVPVGDARKAANALREKRAAFAYLELPGAGHGLPRVAEEDLYRFLDGYARTAGPDSSLREWADEAVDDDHGIWPHVWADLLRLPSPDLLARLRAGGWDAEAAARGLLGAEPPAEAGDVAPILVNRELPPDARRWAASLLGWLGDASAVGALGDAVRSEPDRGVRRAAVRSLRILGPGAATGDLWQAFEDATTRSFTHEAPPRSVGAYREVILLAAETIEALALAGVDPEGELLPAIEEKVLIGLLKEGPVPSARAEFGESADGVRARLAFAVGRVYRRLDAESTLLDMLRVALRRDPALLQAANQGYEEGLVEGRDRSAHRPRWD